jgi:hypothetical protein
MWIWMWMWMWIGFRWLFIRFKSMKIIESVENVFSQIRSKRIIIISINIIMKSTPTDISRLFNKEWGLVYSIWIHRATFKCRDEMLGIFSVLSHPYNIRQMTLDAWQC